MDPFDYNFAHALAVFASTSKTGEVQETSDLLLTSSRAPSAEFNQGFFKTPAYKFDRSLDRVKAFQDRARVPLRLHLASEHSGLADVLCARGCIQETAVPAMILDPIPGALLEAAPDLTIARVETTEALNQFGELAFGSFEFPVGLASVALTPELLALPHVELYVGHADGAPVCCAMLLVTGRIAGIYWVGVVDGKRRRGFGAAVTAHAALAGKRRGCTVASLQASPMGAPVYARLGFGVLREYLRFDVPCI